jgi:acetyl-CoA synthetase
MTKTFASFVEARDFLLAHRTDYETAYREFSWPKLSQFNWALDYFDVMAKGNSAPALWVVGEDGSESKFSFAEMSERSNRVANFLRSKGVKRGQHILLMMPNLPPLWEIMLAAIKLGAVIIPATTLLTHDDLIDRIDRGKVDHVAVITSETGKFANLPGQFGRIVIGGASEGWIRFEDAYDQSAEFVPDGVTAANDTLLLYFTSGTTSKPKLVEHTHQSYPIGHLSTMYWLGLKKGDIHLNISSPGWAKHAWSCFFSPWNAGACVFIFNYARFDAKALLNVLIKYELTTLCAPPTVWRMLIQQDLASYPVKLREVIGAGEPLNPEIIERIKNGWGLDLRDGYGQTETTCQIGNSPGQAIKAGSMGRPMPGYRVALLDLDGKECDEGEVSLSLEPRPLALMVGYRFDAGKNAEITKDGYYRTGDVAARDSDGYITYVGRADDVFKASDYRISPFELESALIEHPAVAEAAVVPSPDPVRLAVPKAFLLLRAGYEPSKDLARDILKHCRESLAPYKRIRRIEFSDLPKTISGKIRRVELRNNEHARPENAGRNPNEYWEEDFPDLKG